MPKKRTIAGGFTKHLQRLYRRAASGPSVPRETPDTQPAPTYHTAKDDTDIAKLLAAQAKRQRKRQKALAGILPLNDQ